MTVKSILKRLLGTEQGPVPSEETRVVFDRDRGRTTIRRSEITTLFRSALDEKQNDLSMRRPGDRP